jgi:hypothetical protein
MFRRRDRRDKAEAAEEVRQDALVEEPEELDADRLNEDEELEDEPEDMTADLESQAADYLADNDSWMYGSSAEAVLEILDRLEDIVPAEARLIAEAWLEVPRSDREQARKAVRKLCESDEETARHVQMAREAVGTWMAVTAGYPEYVKAESDWARVCAQTGEAALDAVTAVIVEEVLDESHFEALFAPWSETTAQLDSAAEAASLETGGSAAPEDGEVEGGEEEDGEDVADEEEARFGPNSDAVADFLNRLWLLSPEQVGRLVSGWQNAPREDLRQAHESLNAMVDEDPEYREQVRHAQEKLAPWLNAGRIQETAGFLGQAGQGESRKMAGPALADAIAALVLGDLLDAADAEVLYGPWFNLIGAPPLPEPAEEETAKAAATSPATGASGGKAKTGGKGKVAAEGSGPAKGTSKTKAIRK